MCVCAIRDNEFVPFPDPQYWGLAKDLGMGLDNVFEITTHFINCREMTLGWWLSRFDWLRTI